MSIESRAQTDCVDAVGDFVGEEVAHGNGTPGEKRRDVLHGRRRLIPRNKRREGIIKAAWQLEDAIKERPRPATYPQHMEARELQMKASQAHLDYLYALKLMVLLTIFETPAWCQGDSRLFSNWDPESRCKIIGEDGTPVNQTEVLLSNLPYIPPGWGIVGEFLIIFLVARKMLLDRKLQLWYFSPLKIEYNPTKLINFGLGCVILEAVDCLIFIVFRPTWRLAFLARTGYLLLLPEIRRLTLGIMAVISELQTIAVFYAGTVCFFAWISVTIFDDLEDDAPFIGMQANKGFHGFADSLNTIFIAGSTDEFVVYFLPSYTYDRRSGLLWLLFLVIVQVLLLNLVLDTLVVAYIKYQEEMEEDVTKEKVLGILKAFETLSSVVDDGEGEVSKETFREFVMEFGRSPIVRPINPTSADIIFTAIDKDHSGLISRAEFCNICGVIEYDFWITKTNSPVEVIFPRAWNHPFYVWFRGEVNSGNFDMFMNYVLLVNFGLIIIESAYDLNKWDEPMFMEDLELAFSLVYVGEVGLNLCVKSWSEYWSSRLNQFDFITTWLLLLSSILDELAESSNASAIKRYMNILRLLRLLRILKQLRNMPTVLRMADTIAKLVSTSRDVLMLLGVVVFFFTTLSVQLWGGILYKSNEALEGSEYFEKQWFVLNFNDFCMSLGVWFVSLLCEYVPVFSDAINVASPIRGSWIVFFIFYVVGVSIIFELVKAFTIEVFMDLKKRWTRPPEAFDTLETIVEECAKHGDSLHYRAAGDMRTKEKVMKAFEEMVEEEEAERGSKHGEEHSHGHSHEGHH